MVHAVDAQAQSGDIEFSFLPSPLLEKCKPFIVCYHELNGFSSLPDILWHPETRKFIEADLALRRQFKKATSSRCAKKAYEGFVSIAAAILCTELLAVGLAGWAKCHPAESKIARALFARYVPGSRARLTERYLFPQINQNCAILSALAPPQNPQVDGFESSRRSRPQP
jgi:hypothetical protein